MTVLVIAEIGVNHNGNVALARQCIDAARDSGADIAKFQTFKANELVNTELQLANYQKKAGLQLRSQLDMLKALQLSDKDHYYLRDYCDDVGIEFLSTAFDIESLDFLIKLGIRRVKIPSGEITNFPLLRHIASYNMPTIMSTGMSTMSEVADALGVLFSYGLSSENLTLLHCTSEYPAPPEEINLRCMGAMHKKFNVGVGYSDHSSGIIVPIAAAALGAAIIEKHLTIDRSLPGPDHLASLEPTEFSAMVRNIREVEVFMGSDDKKPTVSEAKNIKVIRRSIVASKPIKKGEVLGCHNLTAKRPGGGLSPMVWNEVVDTIAIRDFLPDEPIAL